MGMGNGRGPNQRAPLLHREAEVNGSMGRKLGELPVIQDLTPRLPPDEQAAPPGSTMSMGDVAMRPPEMMAMPMQTDVDMSLPSNPMAVQGQRNGFRQPRGGPRGTFGDAASFRPERRNDKTLVVEKIPEDKLSLGAINDWFKKFGTVTNVAVDPSTSKALVSFSDHSEAHAAWKSEDAVFGNRFVKVFWHRPMEGHGQIGARMLAASANLVTKIAGKDTAPPITAPAPPTDPLRPIPSVAPRKPPAPSTAASALAAKQQLLEQQIAEQKSLMSKLTTASAEEKKEIMARLRKLGEEMKPTSFSGSKAASPVPSASTSAAPGKGSRGSTPRTDDKEAKEKERLDKELELHGAVTAADGEGEESTDELKARLARLKAEVCSI